MTSCILFWPGKENFGVTFLFGEEKSLWCFEFFETFELNVILLGLQDGFRIALSASV